MRILAIDDDPLILELLELHFPADQDYVLECHETAERALTSLNAARTPFDCILLDIMLPGMDGIECCQILRGMKQFQNTPILMITASQELGLMQRAFDAGATDFLTKPFNVVELRARVFSAGMLNQSIAKAQHLQQELGRLTEIRFDEMISLNVESTFDLGALESHLLRYSLGCYAISLISMEVPALRIIHSAAEPLHFRACLRRCAHAMTTVMKHDSKIAYIGSGRFVGVSHGRERINLPELTDRFNQELSERWDWEDTGVLDAPIGVFGLAAEQRIWSGLSIANKLRELGMKSDEKVIPVPYVAPISRSEDNIFGELMW